MQCRIGLGALMLCSFLIAPAHALDVQISNNLLMFGGATQVSITGPDSFRFDSSNGQPSGGAGQGGSGAAPDLSFVTPQEIGIVADGQYTYEAKEIVLGGSSLVDDPANGRVQVERRNVQSVSVQSGTFTVLNGAVVDSTISE